MTNAVTIDNYDIEVHERYAIDQITYDPNYWQDTREVSSHFSIAAQESKLLSKWEELFETHLHRHPFANFCPPPLFFRRLHNRFFTHVLSPEFDWAKEDTEEEKEQKKEERRQAQEYKKKIKAMQSKGMPDAIFERDQKALLHLIDSIQTLNGFLRELNARKLQYQKG